MGVGVGSSKMTFYNFMPISPPPLSLLPSLSSPLSPPLSLLPSLSSPLSPLPHCVDEYWRSYAEPLTPSSSSSAKKSRRIPKSANKVLDAPNLINDFCKILICFLNATAPPPGDDLKEHPSLPHITLYSATSS